MSQVESALQMGDLTLFIYLFIFPSVRKLWLPMAVSFLSKNALKRVGACEEGNERGAPVHLSHKITCRMEGQDYT